MAKENNTAPYQIDIGLFESATTGTCSICHPGGGAFEYDRRGRRYDRFLADGGTPDYLNGDYYYFDSSTGAIEEAGWDESGVLEIDCLYCHQKAYSTDARTTEVANRRLRTAPFAGAGFGTVVDANHVNYDQSLLVNGIEMNWSASDYSNNCNQCHAWDDVTGFLTSMTTVMMPKSDIRKRGFVWGELQGGPPGYERDVHDAAGMACLDCHSAGLDHQITKGNARAGTVRDDLDFTVTSCAECHDGKKAVDPASAHESAGFGGVYSFHMMKISCVACHIPFKDTFTFRTVDESSGQMQNVAGTQTINGVYGLPVGGSPMAPSAWTGFSPAYQWWKDADGEWKLFPMNHLTGLLWNEGETMSHPYFIRNVLAAGGIVLGQGKIHDDTGDGYYEINTAQEIADMRLALIDVGAGVGDPRMSDPHLMVSGHPFSITHNIRPAAEALGAKGCTDCHDSAAHGGEDRWFFDGDYLLWHFPMEDSPYISSAFEITTRDGDTKELDIDFSNPANNVVKNWRLMGYSQADHDRLVTPR